MTENLNQRTTSAATMLRGVKVVHTVVWAFFAGCIVALPVVVWRGRLGHALLLCVLVFAEVAVLAGNRWRCPLTAIAERYTDERAANFDIYLPPWLARHNKVIFGLLFGIGVLFLAARWLGWLNR